MAATTFTNAGRFVGQEIIKPAWEHLNQAFVTSAAAFMSAMFSMQHDLLPWWIAVPLAVGFEWTYLRGIAASDKTVRSGWATALNWAALITSVTFSILFILGFYKVIPEHPKGWIAALLAFAHAVPPAVLSFCGASLRRVRKEFHAKLAQQEEVAVVARNQEEKAAEVARNRKILDAEAELRIDKERKEVELEMWQKAQLAKAQLKSQVAATNERNQSATAAATKEPRIIIYNGVEYPTLTAAAEAHGISRQAMAKRLAKEGK